MHLQSQDSTPAGNLAEKLFGYDPREVAKGDISHDLENASALSSSLLVCLLVPWTLCFFFYFGELLALLAILQASKIYARSIQGL